MVYSVGLGTKLPGSGILNFGPCAARDHLKLNPVGRADPPGAGCFHFDLTFYFIHCFNFSVFINLSYFIFVDNS